MPTERLLAGIKQSGQVHISAKSKHDVAEAKIKHVQMDGGVKVGAHEVKHRVEGGGYATTDSDGGTAGMKANLYAEGHINEQKHGGHEWMVGNHGVMEAYLEKNLDGVAEVWVKARSDYYNHETGEKHHGEFSQDIQAHGKDGYAKQSAGTMVHSKGWLQRSDDSFVGSVYYGDIDKRVDPGQVKVADGLVG